MPRVSNSDWQMKVPCLKLSQYKKLFYLSNVAPERTNRFECSLFQYIPPGRTSIPITIVGPKTRTFTVNKCSLQTIDTIFRLIKVKLTYPSRVRLTIKVIHLFIYLLKYLHIKFDINRVRSGNIALGS